MTVKSRGFTIIEVLTAMGVSVLLLSAINLLTGSTFTVSREQALQVRVTDDARIQSQRILDAVRQAQLVDCDNDGYTNKDNEHWLLEAAGKSLKLRANADDDSDLELVRYAIDPTDATILRRQVFQSTDPCSYKNTPDSDEIVLSSLDNGTKPLFTYYSGPDDTADKIAQDPVDAATIITVKRVGLTLHVARAEGAADADTAIRTSAAARAIRCVPGECESFSTQPKPRLTFEGWPEGGSTKSDNFVVGNGQNIYLEWRSQGCDPNTLTASNDHGETAWANAIADAGGPKLIGPLNINPAQRRYIISCSNAYGTTTKNVDVRVARTPQVTLTSTAGTPASGSTGVPTRLINNGEEFTLDWTIADCDGPRNAGNDSASAGFTPPGLIGWDSAQNPAPNLTGSSGQSQKITFPPRQNPTYAPGVTFTLTCTTTEGVVASANLHIAEIPPPNKPTITISGTYQDPPGTTRNVTSDTVIPPNTVMDISWTSSNCNTNKLTANGDWSGQKDYSGVNVKYTHTYNATTDYLALTCTGTDGSATTATLRWLSAPLGNLGRCKNETDSWHNFGGGCADMFKNKVWHFVQSSVEGNQISCGGELNGRSDWKIPSIQDLDKLPTVLPEDVAYLLWGDPRKDQFWWSRDRQGQYNKILKLAPRVVSEQRAVAGQFAQLACVAEQNIPIIWELTLIGPYGGTSSNDGAQISVPLNQSFTVQWRNSESCSRLDPAGPYNGSAWDKMTIPDFQQAGQRTITVGSNLDYGGYILRCVDKFTGQNLSQVTFYISP